MGVSAGFAWRSLSCALATVIAVAVPLAAVAQPAEPENARAPEPGAVDEATPSETPPPPELTPEPPAVVIAQPPVVGPVAPVFEARIAEGPPKVDVMLGYGLSTLALGAVLALSGGITIAARGAPPEYCGPTGCIERVDRHAENIGADLTGAGAGFALVGGASLIAWAADKPTGTERRRSVPLITAGFGMTAFSAAGLGLGIAQAATYAREEADFSTSWPLFVSSGLLAAAGIPLLAIGATNRDDRQRAEVAENERLLADPRVPKKRRSTGMVIGGAILTGLGGLAALAGTGTLIADVAAFDGPSLLTGLVALPTLGGSVLLSSIGIPLLVVGNRKVVDESRGTSAGLPAVTLGAGGLQASWRLQ
jgi:hypothetical protein